MVCTTIEVGGGQTGFSITADQVKGSAAFTTIIHISKPDSPGATVHLVNAGGFLILPSCVMPDIVLDANGLANVEIQVTESFTMFSSIPNLLETGCCTAYDPVFCSKSNSISFTVGTDWETLALVGVGVLGVAYILGNRGK